VILSTIVPNWPALATSEAAEATASDVARVEQIFERHLDAVWRTARDLGVYPRDLEDVVQEVMIVCVRRLADIELDRERPFLLAATARVVANWRRRQRRRPAEPVDPHVVLANVEVALAGAAQSPAEALEHKRELLVVQAALEQMSDQQRVAFTLFEIEGLSAREIAEQLGLSELVVFSRVQRARGVFHRFVARLRSAQNGGGRG
jgi:RNA polymerase sigma-70 factor (ECF subfamily)